MFAIVMFILMIYLFYFGFNIYYDLFHRPKLDRDSNYFVQYEMEKSNENRREEVRQKDFAGILKPNSPRLSKSSTASLTNPRTSSVSFRERANSAQSLAQNLNSKKSNRFARWRVEARRKNPQDDLSQKENSSFLMEEPARAPLDPLARKERQEAVTRRVFENINRSGRRSSKKQIESNQSENAESFLQPLVFSKVQRKVNDRRGDKQTNVDPKTVPRVNAPTRSSSQSGTTAPFNKRISVSEQNQEARENSRNNLSKPISNRALKHVAVLNETKEVQDSKAKWRELMNLAETSIVVERIDGIKVYKSTLFDSEPEAES